MAFALAPARPVPAALLSGCSRLGLLGSADGLELAESLGEAAGEGVVWLLESPEPLCALINLRLLMPVGWEVQLWPRWAPQLHGALDLLIEAGAKPTPARADAPDRRLHWREGRWQPFP
jgi:hypothetical protein